MTENAASEPTREAAGSPALPRPLRTVAVDVVLPWLAVQLLLRFGHLSIVPALAIAAVFPAASMVRSWIRRRHVDFIGLAVFVMILGGISVALLFDDPRFAVLKSAPGFALFGIACLISLTRQRPLMFYAAREFNAAGDTAKAAAWTARLENPRFRQAMRLLTLVWGVALLIEAPLGIAAAFLLPPTTAMVVEPALGISTISALLAWTFAFARRRQTAAAVETAAASPALRA